MSVLSRVLGHTDLSAGDAHRVTPFELFFDLVFVFAITQVTALMADDPTLRGVLRGLVLMALLWWAWCSYAWLGNQARADEGVVRAAVVIAMGGLFVAALTIPEVFADAPAGLPAPAVFAGCYVVVRVVHLGVYALAAGGDAGLRRQLLRTAVPVLAAGAVLVVGAVLGPPAQAPLWALALVVDYVGIYAVGAEGWRLRSAPHFAERHGLIIIIALGESLVAIGVGVAALPVTWPIVAGALLGLTVTVCLWWLYFDVVALVAERVLARHRGVQRARLARDSYTYLHFPMVAGIVYLALGLKKVLEYVADTSHHSLRDALTGVPLLALYGGVAAYLLAHIAFRWRNLHTLNVPRLAVAGGLLAIVPLAWRLPALAALAVLAAVVAGLVVYEAVHYAEARHRVRHAAE